MVDNETEKNILIRNDLNYVLSIIGKDLNTINDSELRTKKEVSNKIYHFIVKEKPLFPSNIVQQILITFHRQFIRLAFSDKLEKIREEFCKILIFLYSNTSNIVKFFPFIFTTLVDKLECRDLEGILHLPEIMRPTISQKPHKVSNLTETSEEVRLLYIRLMEAVIFQDYDLDAISFFIEDIVNITRTLCMDPCSNICFEACLLAKNFAVKTKELLLHFNVQLARGLYMAITHKQSKLRIAGLDALDKVLYCSCFKRNVEIIEDLIGFRDPNLVPIKDFYEGSTKLNYFAQLIADPSFQVRKRFYEILADWLLNLPDRFDHEGRFLPYIMSGLSDQHEEISLQVADILSQIGLQYEKENEKDIIEEKQHGIERKWLTHSENDIWYPFPLSKRPNLGARLIVKKYYRRFVKSMCKEFDAVEDFIRRRVSNLFLYSISHIEDFVVEFLDQVILCFEKEFLKKNNCKETNDNIIRTLRLLGRFCDYEALTNIIYPTIKGDLNANYVDIQRSALMCFNLIVKGHIESLGENKGFGIFTGKLKELFEVLNNPSFLNLDSSTALELIEFLSSFVEEITKKRKNIKQFTEFWELTDTFFTLIITAFGAISLNDTHGNPTLNLKELEKKLESINKNFLTLIEEKYHENHEKITSMLNKDKPSFLAIKTSEFLGRIKDYMESHNINQNSKEYKIFFIILKSKLFGIKDSSEIISQILDIFRIIFEKTLNLQAHSYSISLLIDYIYLIEDEFFNDKQLKISINLLRNCLKPYSEIPDEKFKFVDALKDPKELEKKIKSPKIIKSEVREKTLLFLKNVLMKKSYFYETNLKEQDEKSIKGRSFIHNLFELFNDKELLTTVVHENEKNRVLFIDTFLLYLSKFYVVQNLNGNIKKIEKNTEMMSFIPLMEEYFSVEIFDKNDEISKKSFTVFNFILQLYPTSEFYSSISKTYNDILDKKESELELLKVFAYIDEENKLINSHFKEFKSHFSTIIEFLLDKGVSYKTICEQSFKLILEKFPVYVLNDFMKSKNKNQLNRIKVIDTLLAKFLKSK